MGADCSRSLSVPMESPSSRFAENARFVDDVFSAIGADLRAALQRDPAARGALDVVLSYPGFHAVAAHRFIHALHRSGVPLLPRWLSTVNRFLTGIEIHPNAR